ncbi:glucose-6-phosphate dehydrogenase, partial [Pseudomonas paraeruginosa]|nr:glucose-6-phosphate dehydrogenase [Pseudomonas paraeruginosa]
MLLPSLFALHAEGLIAPDLAIIGTARSTLTDDAYRAMAAEALEEHVPAERMVAEAVPAFLDRLGYVPLDASDPSGFSALSDKVGAARIG